MADPLNEDSGRGGITGWLDRAPAFHLVIYASIASFCTYFCMYAFRKPFAAAKYEGLKLQLFEKAGTAAAGNPEWWLEIDLKVAFVLSQIFGYMLSKYIGVKVCSETTRGRRAYLLIGLISFALLTLFMFAVLPGNWKILAIFLNGLPLGMVWGLVVLYLEGRRISELILAALSCSYIIASGIVKSVGRHLIDSHGVSDFWMPFYTGLIFLPPFLISVLLLNQVPPPSDKDVEARYVRSTMDREKRSDFMRMFLPGMLMLLVSYFFLTAYRDFRDNYQVDILGDLGETDVASKLATSELWVAFGVLIVMGALFTIRNNRAGLAVTYFIMITGLVMMVVGTLLLDAGTISGYTWIVLVGLGAYFAYVPYGSVLFDRLIAATQVAGTAVFAIYLSDAIGYSGSVGVQLYKVFFESDSSYLDFFRGLTYAMGIGGGVLMVLSGIYFYRKSKMRVAG